MKWTLTLGVVPGYENTKTTINLDEVGAIYQTIALRVYEKTNVYVSATLAESRTLYATSWGCPLGGESTVTFSGSHNPAFAEVEAYRNALDEIVRELKEYFKQTTALLEVTPCEIVYYK